MKMTKLAMRLKTTAKMQRSNGLSRPACDGDCCTSIPSAQRILIAILPTRATQLGLAVTHIIN